MFTPAHPAVMKHLTSDRCRLHAIRLLPGQDLKEELQKLTTHARVHAGFILSAAGSLTKASLRMANRNESTVLDGPFEIVSLTGTLAHDGIHVHIAVSDGEGKTTGGHLMEGNVVFTTVELVIGEAVGLLFRREMDERTGFKELVIQRAG
jgi:predicted DNA-binding protein with PD1-like motif